MDCNDFDDNLRPREYRGGGGVTIKKSVRASKFSFHIIIISRVQRRSVFLGFIHLTAAK